MATWILSTSNGNAVEVNDPDLAAQLVKKGHHAYESDPRRPGAKRLDTAPATTGTPIEVRKKAKANATARYPDGEPQAEGWTVKQLKAYAEDHGLELDGARTKPEILAALLTAGEDDDLDDVDEDEDLDGDDLEDEDLGDEEDEDDESEASDDDQDESESKDS